MSLLGIHQTRDWRIQGNKNNVKLNPFSHKSSKNYFYPSASESSQQNASADFTVKNTFVKNNHTSYNRYSFHMPHPIASMHYNSCSNSTFNEVQHHSNFIRYANNSRIPPPPPPPPNVSSSSEALTVASCSSMHLDKETKNDYVYPKKNHVHGRNEMKLSRNLSVSSIRNPCYRNFSHTYLFPKTASTNNHVNNDHKNEDLTTVISRNSNSFCNAYKIINSNKHKNEKDLNNCSNSLSCNVSDSEKTEEKEKIKTNCFSKKNITIRTNDNDFKEEKTNSSSIKNTEEENLLKYQYSSNNANNDNNININNCYCYSCASENKTHYNKNNFNVQHHRTGCNIDGTNNIDSDECERKKVVIVEKIEKKDYKAEKANKEFLMEQEYQVQVYNKKKSQRKKDYADETYVRNKNEQNCNNFNNSCSSLSTFRLNASFNVFDAVASSEDLISNYNFVLPSTPPWRKRKRSEDDNKYLEIRESGMSQIDCVEENFYSVKENEVIISKIRNSHHKEIISSAPEKCLRVQNDAMEFKMNSNEHINNDIMKPSVLGGGYNKKIEQGSYYNTHNQGKNTSIDHEKKTRLMLKDKQNRCVFKSENDFCHANILERSTNKHKIESKLLKTPVTLASSDTSNTHNSSVSSINLYPSTSTIQSHPPFSEALILHKNYCYNTMQQQRNSNNPNNFHYEHFGHENENILRASRGSRVSR